MPGPTLQMYLTQAFSSSLRRCELNRPTLQVRKLREKGLPKVAQPRRKRWSLGLRATLADCEAQKTHHGAFLSGQLSRLHHQVQGTRLVLSQCVATGPSAPGCPQVLRPHSASSATGRLCREGGRISQDPPGWAALLLRARHPPHRVTPLSMPQPVRVLLPGQSLGWSPGLGKSNWAERQPSPSPPGSQAHT